MFVVVCDTMEEIKVFEYYFVIYLCCVSFGSTVIINGKVIVIVIVIVWEVIVIVIGFLNISSNSNSNTLSKYMT